MLRTPENPAHVIVFAPTRGEIETYIADQDSPTGLDYDSRRTSVVAVGGKPEAMAVKAELLASLVVNLGEGDHLSKVVHNASTIQGASLPYYLKAPNEHIPPDLYCSEGYHAVKKRTTHIGNIAVATAVPQVGDQEISERHAADAARRNLALRTEKRVKLIEATRSQDRAENKVELAAFNHAFITVADRKVHVPLHAEPRGILAMRLLQVLSTEEHEGGLSAHYASISAWNAMSTDERLMFANDPSRYDYGNTMFTEAVDSVLDNLSNSIVSNEIGPLILSMPTRRNYGRPEVVYAATPEPMRFSLRVGEPTAEEMSQSQPIGMYAPEKSRLRSTQQTEIETFSDEETDLLRVLLQSTQRPPLSHEEAIAVMDAVMQSGSRTAIAHLAQTHGLSATPEAIKEQLLQVAYFTLGHDKYHAAYDHRLMGGAGIRGVRHVAGRLEADRTNATLGNDGAKS